MSHSHQSQDCFVSLSFESPPPDSNLDQIEIIGVPGKKHNGQYIPNDSMQRFLDDTIARPIFRSSRRIANLDWRFLKIWLSTTDDEQHSYQLPEIDDGDLEIKSQLPDSHLKVIYVLDNELQGSAYRQWQKASESIFTPLFKEFVAPPKFPQTVSFRHHLNPFSQIIESLEDSLDPYARIKRDLFFDTLIIQID